MSLAHAIKQHALALGFDRAGITTADPAGTFEHFRTWIANGYAGAMDYLVREPARRASLSSLMDDVQSVVVVGVVYRTPGPDLGTSRLAGRVSCHAWGDDYHAWMRQRLGRLLGFIQSRVPCHGRICVDTAPLLERDLAQRAGLGWIGKNTMLIDQELGSYLFLGELLLSIPLTPDAPAKSRCGRCTRCLQACPTGALVGPHQLDARRCLSYLTIELKGAVPVHQRRDLADWVYGCDRCQQACPWNRRAPESRHDAYRPRVHLDPPDLLALIGMTGPEFQKMFRGSAMRRTKRRGLLRNVAIVLGNQADARAIDALRKALQDPEPLVRRHAAWALGQIPDPLARLALRQALPREPDPDVRQEIAGALDSSAA